MYDLTQFGIQQMMDVRSKLRNIFESDHPASFEDAAKRIVSFFRKSLVTAEGDPACALVRVYKTHRYAEIGADLQQFARELEPDADRLPDLRCLVLMATEGDEEEWNSRKLSQGHRAIPLSSPRAVEQAPMIAQLIRQLGVDVASVLQPDRGLVMHSMTQVFDVFYVPEALKSPYIPAQDFVQRHQIRSVIGFGGLLTSGDLVAAILFSKVPISETTAGHFKVIGLNFKLAMLSAAALPLFTSEG